MFLSCGFVYIIMYCMITIREGEGSPVDGQMKATRFSVEKETSQNGGQRQKATYDGRREITLHDGQSETTLDGTSLRKTTLEDTTQPSGQSKTIPQISLREAASVIGQSEAALHDDQKTTTPHERTIPTSSQNKTIPQDNVIKHASDIFLTKTTSRDLQITPLDDQSETILETVQRKQHPEEIESVPAANSVGPCQIEVVEWGSDYFHNQLLSKQPHFVQFKIKHVGNLHYDTTKDVFQPLRWSWTYKDGPGPLPFISWKLDYGVFSFHLLETKTISLDREIELNVSMGCHVTYGSDETVKNIVNAFIPLMNISIEDNIPTYTKSYFCYYQIKPIEFSTVNRIIYRYFIANLKIVEYKCAVVSFDYMAKHFIVNTTCEDCIQKRLEWGNYGISTLVLAVLTLLFGSPTIVYSIGHWVAKHEKIIANEVYQDDQTIGDPFDNFTLESDIEDDWLYADGLNHPLNLSDVCSFDRLGLAAKYPAFIGRLRRLIFILMVPWVIYVEIIMFNQGMGMSKHDKVTIESLVKRRVPLGFLSLLGDSENMKYCFAYWLGGPVGMTYLYYILSFIFFVLPRSLKQIVEDGLPSSKRCCFKSPLFLTFFQTFRFSNIINKYCIIPSGHSKANLVIKCRFYMLFSTPFWQYVWTTQTTRWFQMWSGISTCLCILKPLSLPLYLIMCGVEICLCLVYYAIPFCSFVTIFVKGATKSLGYLQRQNRFLGYLFSFRFVFMFVFIVYFLYTYIVSLVFMKSLLTICQIVTYLFLAVIMYPSVAFGYLFFFTVVLYYLIGLVRSFSDGYMELLFTTVKLSRQVDTNIDTVYNNDGHQNGFNLGINQHTDFQINMSQETLGSLEKKVRERNGVYGVPKALFDKLVKEFRPVHREVLSVCFKAAVLLVFVASLLIISECIKSGPNTQISEVMHVVFIVVVGTLPKLLSSILSQTHDGLLKEIEERRMKNVIITYWQNMVQEID